MKVPSRLVDVTIISQTWIVNFHCSGIWVIADSLFFKTDSGLVFNIIYHELSWLFLMYEINPVG